MCWSWIKSKLMWEKTIKTEKKIAIQLNLSSHPVIESWSQSYPNESALQNRDFTAIQAAKGNNIDTIIVGDSVAWGLGFDLGLNFGEPGAWCHHIGPHLDYVSVLLQNAGLWDDIKYIVVGCDAAAGNPLLVKQPVDLVIQKAIEALDYIRSRYPDKKIINFGIPPTVSLHADLATPFVDEAVYKWCYNDSNAVFVVLHRLKAWRIVPRTINTTDGVHESAYAREAHIKAIKKAQTAKPGYLIQM